MVYFLFLFYIEFNILNLYRKNRYLYIKIYIMDLNSEKERLYRQVRTELGAPIRQVELTDEQLCTLLEICIEDYAQVLQDWLIENQWPSLLGQHVDNTDIAFALTTRSLDFMTQYTYAYSKQVGLQARGPWELKKDFIEIVPGQQVYQIPAGREINEVLWVTPNSTDHALFAHYGGFDAGFGGGFAQMGGGTGGGANGGGVGGTGGYYIAPAFDVLLTAADMNLKNRLLRSELAYKLTAGPNGTRLLHLMSTPGSKLTFGNGMSTGTAGIGAGGVGLAGCHVWYHYYDNGGDPDACREANNDIIKLPNEVPLGRLGLEDFNEPTKVIVRQLLVAKSKITLGRVRGKYSGSLNIPESNVTMDYESLLREGAEEWKDIFSKLLARLEKMSSEVMVERQAIESENINKHLKYRPLGFYVY